MTSVAQSDIDFSYADRSVKYSYSGTARAETYDVAVRLDGECFGGKTLVSVSVPVQGGSDISGCRVWLSNSLNSTIQGGKSLNNPDILAMPVKLKNGMLSVTLPEPFEIPQTGVYVGYTFTADTVGEGSESAAPVAGVSPAVTDGFYIHTSQSYPVWQAGGNEWGITSPLAMKIEGDFPAVEARLSADAGTYYVKAGETVLPVCVNVISTGTAPISELTFKYKTDADVSEYTLCPNEPLRLQWGIATPLELILPLSVTKGKHSVDVSLTGINGQALSGDGLTAVAGVEALECVPEHRPLMEEYTGLWCGACPRGLAAMQYMEKKWPERFIAMSYHNDDEMAVMTGSEYPYTVPSLPAAWLDRERKVDAYHGLGDVSSGFGLEQAWLEASARFTPADVSVEALWADEAHTLIEAKADVRFVMTPKGLCHIEYTLLADGLNESAWIQRNYYSGQPGYDELEEMRPFVEGELRVRDVTFDGVVAATSRIGEERPVAFTPVAETPMEFTHTFDTTAAHSLTGYDMVGNAGRLRVVASVVDDNTGRVFNSAVAEVYDPAGVQQSVCTQGMEVSYYDTLGIRLSQPAGLCVERRVMADGTVISVLRRFP